MRARSFVALALAGAGLAAGACAIDIPDVVGADGGADVVALDVVGTEGGPVFDAGPSCDACGAPAGFSPVLFALDRSTPCPSGTTDTDLVADPDGGVGACTCACNVTAQPSCFPATVQSFYSANGGNCTTSGATLLFPADGGCVMKSATLGGSAIQLDPFVPTGGACSDVPTSDTSKVSTVAARMCTASCASETCAAATGYRACFAAAGDVACPSNLEKHTVGAALDLACACGACSITVDGGCEGTLTVFKNPDCTNIVEKAPVDGTCTPNTAPQGSSFQSVSYAPSLVGLGCAAGAASPTVGLTQVGTICCPP